MRKIGRYVDIFYGDVLSKYGGPAIPTLDELTSKKPGGPEIGQEPKSPGQYSDNPIRQKIAEIAMSQVGKGGGGSYMNLYIVPGDTVDENWKPSGNPTVKGKGGGYVFWCGLFALWCYHRAGILTGLKWKFDGSGFVKAAGLTQTQNPKPGDLGYIDKPFNHHDIVIGVEPNGKIHTVDGNATNEPGGAVEESHIDRNRLAFFSIAHLVGETKE